MKEFIQTLYDRNQSVEQHIIKAKSELALMIDVHEKLNKVCQSIREDTIGQFEVDTGSLERQGFNTITAEKSSQKIHLSPLGREKSEEKGDTFCCLHNEGDLVGCASSSNP